MLRFWRGLLAIGIMSVLMACSGTNDRDVAQVEGTSVPDEQAMARWARTCALCHVDGNGGAPLAGNAHDWAPRLEQGMPTLIRHTIDGINAMPPLGYCMSCEQQDFEWMIRFMTAGMPAATDTSNAGGEQ